jgi:hypothetical protein
MKTIWVISYFIINLINYVDSSSNINNSNKELRNLITYVKNMYYNPPFPKFNNITGTGNLIRDKAYKAICLSLNCASGCCNGDINAMTCGSDEECIEYNNYYRILVIIITSIMVPVFSFLIILVIVNLCERQNTCCESLIVTFFIIGMIIVFPISLLILFIRYIRRDKAQTNR